jgi:dGTPase
MTHTLETTAISRVVARALRLNEDLVEAIGLGHDMGHTPFGHAGEDALDHALQEGGFDRRFRHNEQSLRIARTLNLTHEVCDGILTHTGEREPESLEGKIVRLVDRVAYINHDIDDAVRYGLLSETISRGGDRDSRLDRLASYRHARPRHRRASEGVDDIRQTPEVGEAMLSLRAFMFERVYLGPQAAPEHEKAHEVDRGDLRPPRRARRRCRRDRRLHRGHDRPLRARLRRRALSRKQLLSALDERRRSN